MIISVVSQFYVFLIPKSSGKYSNDWSIVFSSLGILLGFDTQNFNNLEL